MNNNNKNKLTDKIVGSNNNHVILDVDHNINDTIINGYIINNEVKHIYSSVIHYNNEGRAYFNRFGSRCYVDEFMRV